MPELQARSVSVTRGGRDAVRALDGVDVSIEAGELVAVMGGTGAGKSTLALVLAGLVDPDHGTLSGAAVGAVRLVLQRPEASFLAANVLDEAMLAPLARGEPANAAVRHARMHLAQLGLGDEYSGRDVLTLSGGEQRRVAIASTLATEASVLVLDEPGAGLDRAARAELHAAIAQLHAAGRTIVLVTHDPDEAASLATRLLVLREGRVAWDGAVAPVLGSPDHARRLGIATSPEVQVLHDVAAVRGVPLDGTAATASRAIAQLAAVLATPAQVDSDGVGERAPSTQPATSLHGASRARLAPLVDARVRVVATALATVAALAAASLLAATIVAIACAVLVAIARIDRARVRLAVRPLVALALLLVLLQLLVGGAPDVDLRRGTQADFAAAPALMRALQASAIVLATLALSACTTMLDLSTALRRLLGPLRVVGVPVATLAFVTATGLGLVPAMSDELERLRLAQRARGLRSRGRSPLARLRSDAALVPPLFVAAFRRAHLLADALAVRGIDPRRPLPAWRALHVPGGDLLLLAAGAFLLVVSRFV